MLLRKNEYIHFTFVSAELWIGNVLMPIRIRILYPRFYVGVIIFNILDSIFKFCAKGVIKLHILLKKIRIWIQIGRPGVPIKIRQNESDPIWIRIHNIAFSALCYDTYLLLHMLCVRFSFSTNFWLHKNYSILLIYSVSNDLIWSDLINLFGWYLVSWIWFG